MDREKTKTIYRMSFEEVEVRPDGTETVVRRIMDQMHGEDDPSDDIGCLIGLIINSICNCDEPWAEPIFVAAIRRVHNLAKPFSDLADAYRDWKGEEDFEDFVEVRRLKDGVPENKLESLRATVAKLPKTRDGAPVIPGERYWTHIDGELKRVELLGYSNECKVKLGNSLFFFLNYGDLFFTEDAAIDAKGRRND